MQIALMHELICIICKLGVSRFKCDFLKFLFGQLSLAGTEDILVTEHARKLGFAAIYSENISTGSVFSFFVSLIFYLLYTQFCSGKIVKIWFCGEKI